MNLTPKLASEDLESYVNSLGFRLSPEAKDVFVVAEQIADNYNYALRLRIFLLVFINNYPQFQHTIMACGGDPSQAIREISKKLEYLSKSQYKFKYGEDVSGERPYTDPRVRDNERCRMIDFSIAIARRKNRKDILISDVLEALLESHEDEFPVMSHGNYEKDRGVKPSFLTYYTE